MIVRAGGAAVLVVAGVLLAGLGYTQTERGRLPGQSTEVEFTYDCARPILDVFGGGADPDGAWFAYAPNTGVVFAAGTYSCRPQAWWRAGGGAALVAACVLFGSGSSRARHADRRGRATRSAPPPRLPRRALAPPDHDLR